MEGIERAIRNALAKVDVFNPVMRQRIYESAWTAYDHMLVANTALDHNERELRRDKLKRVITYIETEFQPVEPLAEIRSESPQFVFGDFSAGLQDMPYEVEESNNRKFSMEGPSLDKDDIRPIGKMVRGVDLSAYGDDSQDHKKEVRRRLPLFSLFLSGTILLGTVFVGWLLFNNLREVYRAPPRKISSDSSHSVSLQEDDKEDSKWITVFLPSDPTRISVSGSATSEISGEGSRRFVRVKTSAPRDEVSFDVGQGILDKLAGKKAIFDIVARSDNGELTQMSVSCDFGGSSDCNRKRYDVTSILNNFLFDVQVGDKGKENGRIMINSNISGRGNGIDIFSIKVSIAE